MKVLWTGVREFDAYLEASPRAVEKAAAAALMQEGENMMAVSKRRTPKDFGYLRASGHVKPPKVSRGNVVVELAYGTDYAIYVHEIMSNQHPVGQAKYLESAMKDGAKGLIDRLASRFKEALT